MTRKDAEEAARDYIAARRGTIDQWESKEQGCRVYDIAYWVWRGKECIDKAREVGTDFVAVVDMLKEKEQRMMAGEPEPAAEEAVATLVPAALLIPSGGFTSISGNPVSGASAANWTCPACGTINLPGNACSACGTPPAVPGSLPSFYCPACGSIVDGGTVVCPYCTAPIP